MAGAASCKAHSCQALRSLRAPSTAHVRSPLLLCCSSSLQEVLPLFPLGLEVCACLLTQHLSLLSRSCRPAGGAAPVPAGLGEDPGPPPLRRHRHPQGPGAQGGGCFALIMHKSMPEAWSMHKQRELVCGPTPASWPSLCACHVCSPPNPPSALCPHHRRWRRTRCKLSSQAEHTQQRPCIS